MRARVAVLLALLTLVSDLAPARANPVPDSYIRDFENAVSAWPTRPDSLSAHRIEDFLASYGLERHLISQSTVDRIEKDFDLYAPLVAEAQKPPRGPQPGMVRWYRERADQAQMDTMRVALREWLTAPVTEAWRGSTRIVWNDQMIQETILAHRLTAAEILGDLHDQEALPSLRALLEQHPRNPVLVAAIMGITDSSHARTLETEKNGRLTLRRSADAIESIQVSYKALATDGERVWYADPEAIRKIWSSVGEGWTYEVDRLQAPTASDSLVIRQLIFSFRDGLSSTLENRGHWVWIENGHPSDPIEVTSYPFYRVAMAELERSMSASKAK